MKDGRYIAQGVEAVLGYARNGSQQIEILFEVCDGPAKGERIPFTGSFKGGAAEYTLASMRLCGWAPGRVVNECCKKKLEIEAYTEEYEDSKGQKQTAQKVRIRTPRTTLQTPMDRRMAPADAAKFLADLAGAAPPAPAAPAERSREPGDDDDDMPNFG